MALYSDPILAKLISILNAEGPKALKSRYYQGDPVKVVSKSQLPAVFLSWNSPSIDNISNAEDGFVLSGVMNVVYDLTRDWNQAFDKLSSQTSLWEWVQAMDSSYNLRSDSILYVLRKHQALDTKLWINMSQPVTVDYGIGMQKRGPGMFSVEAVIRFQITHHQLRPGLGG